LTTRAFLPIGDALRFERFKIQLPTETTINEAAFRKFRNTQRLFSLKKKYVRDLTLNVDDEWKRVNEDALSWVIDELATCERLKSLK
jgi:hypothetical protein